MAHTGGRSTRSPRAARMRRCLSWNESGMALVCVVSSQLLWLQTNIQSRHPERERLVLHVYQSGSAHPVGKRVIVGKLQHARGQITVRTLAAPRDHLADERQHITEVPAVQSAQNGVARF